MLPCPILRWAPHQRKYISLQNLWYYIMDDICVVVGVVQKTWEILHGWTFEVGDKNRGVFYGRGQAGGPKAKIVRVSEKLFSSLSSKLLWAALGITLAFKLSVFQGHGQFRTSLRLWRKRFHKTSAGKIKKFLQMGISLAYMPLMLSCQDHSWGHKTSIVPWWLREETHSSHSPIIITTAFGQKSDTLRFW